MTYRNILVHVDSSKAARTRLTAATKLAQRFQCALTGFCLRSDRYPRHLIADGSIPIDADTLNRIVEERAKEVGRVGAAARRVFDEALQDAGVAFHWLDIDGDSETQLIAAARRHDLAVLPPEMRPVLGEHSISAAQIGMASAGPVLVLKHGGYPMDFGRKILVAWNNSRESARALRDAWPFLAAADEVHFLTVSPSAETQLDDLMQRHLRNHGCKFGKMVVDRSDAASVADVIKLHVGETGADMVVMGLYGHSRLQEMVLGGVSRNLLHDPPMPMLISH